MKQRRSDSPLAICEKSEMKSTESNLKLRRAVTSPYTINFIAGVRKGLRELDEGKGIDHERVREEFKEWLSS
jgi:predicted transcriptional regulator